MDEIERLRRENETLRALLFLNNVQVEFSTPSENLKLSGTPSNLKSLATIQELVFELKTNFLLLRADAIVLKEELSATFQKLYDFTTNKN